MANAIKRISVARGHDVTAYTLQCFGGAGGQHACLVADALGMTRVLIHPMAGVLSAYGMGLADQGVMREQAVEAPLSPEGWPALQAVAQQAVDNRAALQQRLDEVVAAGGEGLVLHHADAPQASGRSPWLWKHKPLHDAEALVLAHLPGQGRYAGQLGALQVRTDTGQVLAIGTGFSDADRQQPPAIGQRVTYTYRGLTAGGVPRFASYLRPAHAE